MDPILTPIVDHAQYYVRRDERLFHAFAGHAPYPLPVDTPEQERIEIQHQMLKGTIGSNFFGPVEEVLHFTEGRQRMVLDLGTGKGHWAIDMARQFRRVMVHGIDHVPIMETVDLPDNVDFIVEDINQQINTPAGTVDLCHARDVSLAVVNYGALLDEVHRLLRRGGLFLSGEWELNNMDGAVYTKAFMNLVMHAFQDRRGLHWVPVDVLALLEGDTRFREVQADLRVFPLGNVPEPNLHLGDLCREIFSRFMDSVKPLLKETVITDPQLNALYRNVRQELTRTSIHLTYHMVWARKA